MAVLLVIGVMDFKEIRDAISAPIILMSAGVIGVADALGSTGLTDLVGSTVANMLGTNINPFIMIFIFCVLTSVLATLTGSTIGTVYVFAPLSPPAQAWALIPLLQHVRSLSPDGADISFRSTVCLL